MRIAETIRPVHEARRQEITRELFRLDAQRQIFAIQQPHLTMLYLAAGRENFVTTPPAFDGGSE